jgi:hypothetical protein
LDFGATSDKFFPNTEEGMSRGSLGFITSLLLLFCSSVGAQQWQWVQSFSGEGAISTQVGHDDAQNVYVAGTFRGTN